MINSEELEDLFVSCLFNDDEPTDNMIPVEGVMSRFGFHPERLEASREQVKAWLAQLPDSFHKSGGGGMSFLNACTTKDDEHWGEHTSVDRLFCLGMGLGLAKCLMPRKMWSILPGGMPYFVVDLNPDPVLESIDPSWGDDGSGPKGN